MKKLAFIYILAALYVTCFTVNTFAADFYVIPAQNKCGPCEGTCSVGGRWCDNGDGTVTDMTTCLVWLKYANWGGKYPWRSGETDCGVPNDPCYYDDARQRAGLLESGETISTGPVFLEDGSVEGDWRLPTKTELSDIINEGGETVSYSNTQLFKGVVSSQYYWSNTTHVSNFNYAYRVFMNNGAVTSGLKEDSHYMWPVRDSK